MMGYDDALMQVHVEGESRKRAEDGRRKDQLKGNARRSDRS